MADTNLKLKIDTSELDRLAIGGRIYDMLDLANMDNSLTTDNGKIAIYEKDIIDIFYLVNRSYKRTIKII